MEGSLKLKMAARAGIAVDDCHRLAWNSPCDADEHPGLRAAGAPEPEVLRIIGEESES